MCGIAGIYNFEQGCIVDKRLLKRINQSMLQRGPDNSGFWYAENQQVGLAHNRLSFVDLLPRSNQPMEYSNGRYVITYNGEIYNYKELRQTLVKKKYNFKTASDTEVIMAMYDCYGASMLEMLRGMFAFAIWDKEKKKLFAARDPFGIKPFYYYKNKDTFIFASQVKAIAGQLEGTLTPSPAGWCGFIRYGSVPEPHTIYKQVQVLPAGHYLEINQESELCVNTYFSIYDEFAEIENTTKTNINYQTIDLAISDSVKHHLVADVPVALFLSSGIDSTMLASYLTRLQDNVSAFTLDFEDFKTQHNESDLARETASSYQLEHQVIHLNVDAAALLLDKFFTSMDQPSIDGLNVWLISQAVAAAGYRAVISGLGADEVLAGYPSFVDVPKYSKLLHLKNKISKSGVGLNYITNSSLLKRFVHPKIKGFGQFAQDPFLSAYHLKRNLFLEDEFGLFFDDEFWRLGLQQLNQEDGQTSAQLNQIRNSYLKVSALEIDYYMKNQLLKDADWASMHHSLELRVPFVDWPLIKSCANEVLNLTNPRKREIVKKTLNGRLPEKILTRQKTGFKTPVEMWLRTLPDLSSWKSKRELAQPNCPWARRWAYEVKSRFLS